MCIITPLGTGLRRTVITVITVILLDYLNRSRSIPAARFKGHLHADGQQVGPSRRSRPASDRADAGQSRTRVAFSPARWPNSASSSLAVP
jgi:hypothetical protein